MSQLDAIMAGGKAVIHTPIRNGVRANTVILEIRFSVSKNSRLVSRVLTEDQLADFAQAVIFHASDRDSAPAAAEGGVAGGHDEHKMTDDYDDPSAAAATVFSPTRKAVVQVCVCVFVRGFSCLYTGCVCVLVHELFQGFLSFCSNLHS